MTVYTLCLEQVENRWIAHVLALPACFAADDSRAATIAAAPAIADYFAWLRAHGETASDDSIHVEVDEVQRAWNAAPDYEVNAFFAADRPPLTGDEIARALLLLEWTRADLLAAVEGLSAADLAREIEGERWPIMGVLNHVGLAEWWYLDRLHLAFPREQVPHEAIQRLEKVRTRFRAVLPSLAGDERVTAPEMELWSPRKMLRRALWHERDHTAHIRQLRARL